MNHNRRIPLTRQLLLADLFVVAVIAFFCQPPLWAHYSKLAGEYVWAGRIGLLFPEACLIIFVIWAIFSGYHIVKQRAFIAHISLAVLLVLHGCMVLSILFHDAGTARAEREAFARRLAEQKSASELQVDKNKADAEIIRQGAEQRAQLAESQGKPTLANRIRQDAERRIQSLLAQSPVIAALPSPTPEPTATPAVGANALALLDAGSAPAKVEVSSISWSQWLYSCVEAYIGSFIALALPTLLTLGFFFWVMAAYWVAGAHEMAHLVRTPASRGAYDVQATGRPAGFNPPQIGPSGQPQPQAKARALD